MLLKLLYYFGLTNLSLEDVNLYLSIKDKSSSLSDIVKNPEIKNYQQVYKQIRNENVPLDRFDYEKIDYIKIEDEIILDSFENVSENVLHKIKIDNEVIIEKIKSGNNNQLAMIYREYRSEFIAWITTNYSCSRDEARDVYQISILALHENILNSKKHVQSSIKTYLFAIGKNKFLEFRKSDARIGRAMDASTIELEEVSTWEYEEKEQNLNLVEKSLEILEDPCRSLLEMYFFHGMSINEIAGRLSYKNKATAQNLKGKCLVRLRKIFFEQQKKQRREEEKE